MLLFAVLERELLDTEDRFFTRDVRDAWESLYDLIATAMMEGAEAAAAEA